MTKEDKELLLQDLCARLPYGVKCKVHLDTKGYCLRDEDKYCDDTLESINCRKQTCTFNHSIGYNLGNFVIEEIKPYLRPMSSMTEEEKEELKEIGSEYLAKWENAQDPIDKWRLDAEVSYKRSEFYNSHLLDWHGLIPKGLAIETPVDMYKID